MSKARGMLAQSPEPEAHEKVLGNDPELGLYVIGIRSQNNLGTHAGENILSNFC